MLLERDELGKLVPDLLIQNGTSRVPFRAYRRVATRVTAMLRRSVQETRFLAFVSGQKSTGCAMLQQQWLPCFDSIVHWTRFFGQAICHVTNFPSSFRLGLSFSVLVDQQSTLTRAYLECLPWTAGLVAAFNQEVGITGAILTKLDGDSRGGAALSVKEVRR